ncbi:DUF4017 domain-containing protein [Alteribacter keqinensis]|uniref:DUF4017 domain-containing protein n=2 Tax=Alteribacter keqinensis TaxID=2483800 RepID=A0A3M7TVM8_9BACI|nr:DUF4017 family protein [Alteribacter keqinensis]RNA69299.1 DUF4017 domain-containing protein [Alteribacter keqinensis]
MKNLSISLAAYVTACIIALILPTSEGYNTLGWKLFVGHVYAIPAFILVFIFLHFFRRKQPQSTGS